MRAGLMQDLMALERRVVDLSAATKDGGPCPAELRPVITPIAETVRQMWEILYDMAHDLDDAAAATRRAAHPVVR